MFNYPDLGSCNPGLETRWQQISGNDCLMLHCTVYHSSSFHCLGMTNNVERDVKHKIIMA